MIAGYPREPAKQCRGAAEPRRAFNHQHAEPQPRGNRRGGEPTRTRPDDDDIEFLYSVLPIFIRCA